MRHIDYQRVSPETLSRALTVKEVCESFGVPLRAAALAFPGRHPAVASILLGARSAAEVRDGVETAAAEIPEELWADLRSRGLVPGERVS